MDFAMKSINHAQKGVTPPPTHGIRHMAEQLELDEAKKFEIIPKQLYSLGNLLDEVYTMLIPGREDYEARKALITFVDNFAKQNIRGTNYNCSGTSARAFGSYTMDIFTSGSDLDLSVNLGYTGDVFPRENKIKALRILLKAFYRLRDRGMIRGIEPVLRAIVPVLKFVDCRSTVECDISIENKDGILKSEMLRIISSIDKRFQKLCYLMKAWAKAQNINSSRDRTLNSLSIILLVALHLQTRSPPILPAFSVFVEDEVDIEEVEKRVLQYKNFGIHNKESIPELFISLLCKLLSVESLWQEALCASTYEGNWISKKLENKIGCINVEDFTNRNQNAARSVNKNKFETIYNCIRETLSSLQLHLKGLSEASDLKAFLFGPAFVSQHALGQTHETEHQVKGKRRMPFGYKTDQKKMRFTEDEQRDDSAVGKLPVMHSGVEGTNFTSRSGESFPGNAVHPVHRFVDPPMPGYGQSIEQEWEARSSQWQDPRPGPRYPPLLDVQQGLRHGPGYRQGYGLPHELSQLNPYEGRYLDSFQYGLGRQISHLTPLEAKFASSFPSGQVHKMPSMIPFESRFANSFHNGQAHQMSHLTHLESRFMNPRQNGPVHPRQNGPEHLFQNNWNLNHLPRR